VTKISNFLADYVSDGDLHARLENVKYSTGLRKIITIGDMLDHFEKEKSTDKVSA